MGTQTVIYMPDGLPAWPPNDPRTWVDESAGQKGDALRAPLLTMDASANVAWHRQRPLFQGIQTLAQSIPATTFTAITGLSELIDNYSGHSDTTNTGRYYVPWTGTDSIPGDYYLCTGYVPFNTASAAFPFIAGLRKNGGGTIAEGGRVPSGAGHVVDTMVIDLVQLDGGAPDYVELVGYNATASPVNTVVSGKTPSLTVRWVAADPNWSGFYAPALPAIPHTWADTDVWTASATGGAKVPFNTELRDYVRFLNNPPIARVTAVGTTQTMPNAGAWTSVNMLAGGLTVDNYGGWAAANPSRYTAQRAGLYLIAGFVNVTEPGTNAGYRAARLKQTFAAGGSQTYAGWTCLPQVGGTTGTGLYAVSMLRMAVGDYVEVQMAHTHTAALTLFASGGNASRLVAVWMAA